MLFGQESVHPPLETGHIQHKWLDLPYAAQSPAQKLDLYLPNEGEGPFPLLATFHSGAWLSGDKAHAMSQPFLAGLQRGYAVACINYRLSSEAQFPSQIYDCKASIRYLRANAAKYQLDGKHIGVWGVSAGGYLAALLGTSAKVKELDDQTIKNSNNRITSKVQAVVIWHGPIESFLRMDAELETSGKGIPNHSDPASPESRLLGRKITYIPALVEFASPMTYIDKNSPPFLIQHGLHDELVPVEQSIHFADKLEKVAGSDKVTLEILSEARNADPIFRTPENIHRVLDFFDLHLKGQQKNMINQHTQAPHYAIIEAPPPADTSHIKRKFLDIAYAHVSPAQKLDIYLPKKRKGPFPVIMAFHGGAFMGCDKADLQVLPMLEGLERGYAVVSVNYRMSGEAKFPALVQDAKAAVRWVRGNAVQYKLNPNKIAAWGGSAGGYLVNMLGTSAGIPELEDLSLGNPNQPCNVQAVVAWFAPANFLKMDAHLEASGLLAPPGFRHNETNSPESLLMGQLITEIPDKVKAANPETYIRRNAPCFLLQHGTKDPVVPVQQSIEFAAKLKEAIGEDKVTLELLEGAEHADVRFETPENVRRVLDFLDEHLKKS